MGKKIWVKKVGCGGEQDERGDTEEETRGAGAGETRGGGGVGRKLIRKGPKPPGTRDWGDRSAA